MACRPDVTDLCSKSEDMGNPRTTRVDGQFCVTVDFKGRYNLNKGALAQLEFLPLAGLNLSLFQFAGLLSMYWEICKKDVLSRMI